MDRSSTNSWNIARFRSDRDLQKNLVVADPRQNLLFGLPQVDQSHLGEIPYIVGDVLDVPMRQSRQFVERGRRRFPDQAQQTQPLRRQRLPESLEAGEV